MGFGGRECLIRGTTLSRRSPGRLFTYALAWGIYQGVVDGKVYRPVVDGKVYRPVEGKAWAGMLKHVYADGRLGCIHRRGRSRRRLKATASYTYGVGAFLMAASEIRRMGGAPAGANKG
jgi:unsaturated rhamnogalacturonyl hydrolase